jgi:hypothetical protein
MHSISLRTLCAALAVAGLLAACGGGGGSDAAAQSTVVDLNQGVQTYRLASQFGKSVALTMDTGAGTFSYTAGNTTMSGTLRATSYGTYVLNTGVSAANLQAELQIKDGAVGGALMMTSPLTGSLATAVAAGANEKLILKDSSKVSARYAPVSINTNSCNISGIACGDGVSPPDTVTKVSATQMSMVNCTVPAGASVQTALTLDTAACPANNGAPGLRAARTWTADAGGNYASSAVTAPNTYKAFFAEFGGKVVGFADLNRPSSATTPVFASLTVLFPITEATQAAELIGTWNFVSKTERLSVQVNSLTDAREYATGQTPASGSALGPFTLNQWGTAINTMSVAPDVVPVFVAGPWATTRTVGSDENFLGLKR